MVWRNVLTLGARKFACGFCQFVVASDKGFVDEHKNGHYVYICPNCECPTFFTSSRQFPDIAPGNPVKHLPKEVAQLYEEARNSVAANAPTAAVLTCRKLLMNIAVAEGARPDGTFLQYVDYLAEHAYVPPKGREWVDHIRKKGNEANHEIHLMTRDDAMELVEFAEMLLKFIYEFPKRVPQAKAS